MFKLCKDCRYFVTEYGGARKPDGMCAHPSNRVVDVVEGGETLRYEPKVMRLVEFDCGVMGRLWEGKR